MASTNGGRERLQSPSCDSTPVGAMHFYIFRQGISFSVSPTIHLAGFRYYNLPHTYEIHQTGTVDELHSLVTSPSFGGASVAMPHKLAIWKFCSTMTEHVRVMGAVNTIIREDMTTSRLRGDNTDWTGLVEILKQKSKDLSIFPEAGLIIGAGGASRAALYAMYQMGLKTVYLFNRTISRAEDIAHDFACLFKITVLYSLENISKENVVAPDVIIGTY